MNPAFAIGPAVVTFESNRDGLLRAAAVPHAGYATDAPADIQIRLASTDRVLSGPVTPEVRPPGEIGAPVELAYHGWRATWEPASGRVSALVSTAADSPGRAPRRIASLTRTVVGQWLLARGGLSFHGASLVSGGRAHLFVGPRGAGKTTLATRWPGDIVLGDDHAIVMAGPQGGYDLFGTPYRGREGTPGQAGRAPLVAIYLLEQSLRSQIRSVPVAAAFSEVLRHLIVADRGRESAETAMASLERLLAQVPVRRIGVSLKHDPWPVIHRADAQTEAA